jgi:hypothetical protein
MQRDRRSVVLRARRWCPVLVAVVAAVGTGFTGTADAASDPIGIHSMLQLNDPPSFMQDMFAEAAAAGASSIRLDVAPALIFTEPTQPPDFSGLDEVMALSQEYHLPVVGDLFTIPYWIADCATPTATSAASRCPTDDLADYGAEISQIVAHANPVIQDWEIWNEPDSQEFFTGTPQQYAMMLRTAHDAIKQVNPADEVLLGGVSGPSASSWLTQVFATPGADAAQAFDIANVHERAPLDSLAPDIENWKSFFASYGFTGPLWITEHGYPSDPAYQYDPSYQDGLPSQAAYLTASIPTLVDAGASEVFITERDNLGGPFASEGLLGGDVTDASVNDPEIVQKPAYAAVTSLAGCYMLLGRDCPGPAPAASPSALSIPATHLGTETSSTITISDPGPGPDQLGAVVLLGPTPDPITVADDDCAGRILEPNQTCQVTMRFTPLLGGPAAAIMQLPSDNGTLSVGVTSTAPSVSNLTSPDLMDPTFTPVHTADGVGYPQQLTLRLTNPLSSAVRVDRASVTGSGMHRFTIHSDHCAHTTLKPQGSCQLSMRFVSFRPGPSAATLVLRGDGTPLSVALRATAFALPDVMTMDAISQASCRRPRTREPVKVTTNQPATISWQLRRIAGRVISHCKNTRASSHRAGHSSGHEHAHEHAMARGNIASTLDRSYSSRISLPGGARHTLRPGTYRLKVSAHDVHGTGPTRTMSITIEP